jgi:hypothetical protein
MTAITPPDLISRPLRRFAAALLAQSRPDTEALMILHDALRIEALELTLQDRLPEAEQHEALARQVANRLPEVSR